MLFMKLHISNTAQCNTHLLTVAVSGDREGQNVTSNYTEDGTAN